MADLSGPASAARPVQALPPRQLAVPWIAVAVLAAGAWVVTVMLARDMGNGPEPGPGTCPSLDGRISLSW
jgi:hypothetical protein